ncbi:hypothetical protein [Flagellimonas lutimaris]|uniref:hypothetical protein n=1 Tax=Flagellimonas lutimaris TaxID=475082 RepID=UPI003F5CE88B
MNGHLLALTSDPSSNSYWFNWPSTLYDPQLASKIDIEVTSNETDSTSFSYRTFNIFFIQVYGGKTALGKGLRIK